MHFSIWIWCFVICFRFFQEIGVANFANSTQWNIFVGWKSCSCSLSATMVLSISEKLEIIELARRNSYRRTAIIFNQLHPDRNAPLHFTTIAKLFQNLRSRGSLERKKRTVSPRMAVEINNFREEVLVRINENPHLSTRRVAAQLGKSHTSVWKVLKNEKFNSYKMSKHQKLHADDPPKRKKFCEDLLEIFRQNASYQHSILWTDEKSFPINGCFNRQNFR